MKRDDLINKLQQLDSDTIVVIEDRHGNLHRALDLWVFEASRIKLDECSMNDEYYQDTDGNNKVAVLVNEGTKYEDPL